MRGKASTRDWIIGTLALALLPCLIAVWTLLWIFPCIIEHNRPCVEKRLESHAAEYAAMAGFPEESGAGYVSGRLVAINVGEAVPGDKGVLYQPNKLNLDVHFQIPNRAYAPQDVGTVVLLRWAKELTGERTYGAGILAYKITGEVLVIDKQRQKIVARKTLEGDLPPEHLYYNSRVGIPEAWRSSGIIGSFSNSRISDFIEGLPRRDPR